MKITLLIVCLLLFNSASAKEFSLNPFITDYCTNFPEGTKDEPELWKHCCLMHDLYFWVGGSKNDRSLADLELRECIDATGVHLIARLVYFSVRVGSYSPIKYPDKKWSNGWIDRPDFKPLSDEEILLIENEIHSGYENVPLEQKRLLLFKLRLREN